MLEVFQKLQSRGLLSNDGNRRICIRLTVGKDRDTVMRDLTKQVEDVAKCLPTPPIAATTDNNSVNEPGETPN
jgi:hypothetical protein